MGKPSKWYEAGLQFSCTECGDCCKGEGVVWLTREDCRNLAKHLGVTVKAFMAKQTSQTNGHTSLHVNDTACQFLDVGKNKCTVHESKPKQCRSYPFWGSALESRKNWDGEQSKCEGINTGKLITVAEITGRMYNRL